ncbi:MAG TPA: hypothetical protein VFD89_03495 [Clostridia bacterium]|nr:hypothetical protein [Clostridia bacterium]
MTNRTPLKKELLIGEAPLLRIIEIFDIKKIVAVGNKADESLTRLGIDHEKVRHPAQGGKNEFVRGIRAIKKGLMSDNPMSRHTRFVTT